MPTLREKKAIRKAKKARKLAAAQERYLESNRSAKYLVCLLVATGFLVTAIICASMLMQLYAAYKYETTPVELSLPVIIDPGYVIVEIAYQDECPSDYALYNHNIRIDEEDIDIDIDDKAKILSIGCDIKDPTDSLKLKIKPENNFELQYKATVEPSFRYMTCKADIYTSQNGDLWISLYGSFRRLEKDIRCSVSFVDNSNGHIVYQDDIAQDEYIPINISAVARSRKLAQDNYPKVSVWFEADTKADPLDPSSKKYPYYVESINYTFDIADWPEYAEDDGSDYSMLATQQYISTYSKEMTPFEK